MTLHVDPNANLCHYRSRECQKADWTRHRLVHKRMKKHSGKMIAEVDKMKATVVQILGLGSDDNDQLL